MREKLKGWLAGLVFRLIALLTWGQISPILSACAIVERDGVFLLVERADGLGYTLPGGIVRYRETIEAALLREVHEETGYLVRLEKIIGVYSDPERDPRLRAVSIAYQGQILGGEQHNSSEGKACWRSADDVFGHMAFDCETMLKDYLSGEVRLS
ncbi:NUDIX domain-containing protein [Ktedonospora formicarum]|uniref:Nudix hydrolase domain-containing protein n=1 Tax=Ktedonospora formicarum TaxID=2778364 RepID=A0A8J3HYP3_9CHLR|nr:NUDIX hydrolase [Ktedonospora formicarum]GHO42948.1 hypothetical protein KSX_11110 [Ktedonospora formicarum]